MCNHYQNHPEALQTWAEYSGWSQSDEFSETSIDVWPKRTGLVARVERSCRIIDSMTWGVPLATPGKRPGTTITKHVTNVRNLASRFWRTMLAKHEQRCLVPFTRFAEPMLGKGREEHWFSVNGRPVAAFAGIWRPSEAGNVYAFLTCEPNPLIAPLHPKAMPVILHEADHGRWLTGTYDDVCGLAVPYPSQLMNVD